MAPLSEIPVLLRLRERGLRMALLLMNEMSSLRQLSLKYSLPLKLNLEMLRLVASTVLNMRSRLSSLMAQLEKSREKEWSGSVWEKTWIM